MTKINRETLIAPCGMDCSLCSSYLAYAHGIPKQRVTHCAGCRPRNKQCAFLKKRCKLLRDGTVEYCFECADFPCDPLKGLDARYRKNYGMSFIENLELIRDHGIRIFLKRQKMLFSCDRCNNFISIHNKKCFVCDEIRSWKD